VSSAAIMDAGRGATGDGDGTPPPTPPASDDGVASIASLLPAQGYSRERALALAGFTEQCGRHEDMCDVAAVMADRATDAGLLMSPEERTVTAVAFKTALSSFRGTLKMLGMVAQAESSEANLAAVFTYARAMEAGVLALAGRVLRLAVGQQGPLCEDALAAAAPGSPLARAAAEAAIFFYKLGGDYARYVSECHTDPGVVATHSDLALSYYSKARAVAGGHLHPGHPLGLGVLLNFSVFLFEVRHCEEEAYELAAAALDEVAVALRTPQPPPPGEGEGADSPSSPSSSSSSSPWPPLSPQERSDSAAVQSLIRENLRVWAQVLELSSAAATASLSMSSVSVAAR
jgi:14-3-3 protein epsilon